MANQFISNSTVTYDVDPNGTTTVTHDISLQNMSSDFYATSYTLSLSGISPINPAAYEGGLSLPIKIKKENNSTSIEVNFPDEVVGKDAKRDFSITFDDKTLVHKIGEIWEIITPKLADASSFDFYSTIIKIPNSFGNLAYISPNPTFQKTVGNQKVFSFDKNASLGTTITAAFGNFQVFSFKLTYHLENPLNEVAITTVALPPDTSYQKLNYTKISPKPQRVDIDQDGNWIATFQLKAHEKIDVITEGAVQIFASPQLYPKTDYSSVTKDLVKSEYWQIDDPKIIALAKQLKTPANIYNYVTTHLTYDYSRVAPDVQRFGAVKALESPKNAICTEFTDLFIALSRAAGIPAREIEGFAYTDNPKIQPLSLVADVLHAWPEYWDANIQSWVPVDPTWGQTSGIDYFDKLDLKHFAFAIHGTDPKKPYPAGSYKEVNNPQKDVEVVLGQLPQNHLPKVQIQNTILSQLPFSDEIIQTRVVNAGPVAVYDQQFEAQFDSKTAFSQNINVIPPFSFSDIKINVPYSFLGQTTPGNVQILVAGEQKSQLPTYKNFVTISNLLMLCLFVFFIISMIYLKFKDAKKRSKKDNGVSGGLPL